MSLGLGCGRECLHVGIGLEPGECDQWPVGHGSGVADFGGLVRLRSPANARQLIALIERLEQGDDQARIECCYQY
jgi:hypothetical protein